MSDRSAIEWTDASWNPIRARCWEIQSDGSGKERIGWHCEHVSEGCRNCYAESINRRLGTGFDYKPGNLRGKPGYYGGGNDRPEIFLDEKMLLVPLRWRRPRKIFVGSMTDLFADFVTDEMLDRIFAVMALCPQHTFQVLTKRATRMCAYLGCYDRPSRIVNEIDRDNAALGYRAGDRYYEAAFSDGLTRIRLPLPNVWLGVSCERQEEYNERWPMLRATPAAIRFISYEPALGPLSFIPFPHLLASVGPLYCDWLICGGESGSHARPMHPDWARSLRDQCKAAGVAFFYKQTGEWAPCARDSETTPRAGYCNPAGHGAKWPSPEGFGEHGPPWLEEHGFAHVARIGKKAAGRLLDGREHNDMPGCI